MKFDIEEGGVVLRLLAESGEELDIIGDLAGVKGGGVFSRAQQLRVLPVEVPFAYDDKLHGVHYFAGDPAGGVAVLLGLELQLGWISYKEPLSPDGVSRQNVALRIGHGLLDALELLQGQRPE